VPNSEKQSNLPVLANFRFTVNKTIENIFPSNNDTNKLNFISHFCIRKSIKNVDEIGDNFTQLAEYYVYVLLVLCL